MAKSHRNQQVLASQQTPALGTKVVYDIPLTADLSRIVLALDGSVTLSTAATGLLKDGICELIKTVELKRNGSDTLVSVPFSALVNGNMFRRRRQAAPTLTQPGVTAAAQAFSAIGILDLAAYGALRPKDSVVRETDCKTLQLIVTIASDFSGVFYGNNFAVSASSLTLTAKADEILELQDATGKQSAPRIRPLFSNRDDTVSGAANRNNFKLTPDQALRGITLRASTSAGLNSDAVLGAVRVYVGKRLALELTAAAIRADNKGEHNAAVPTGYYFLDFAEQGAVPDRLEDCYDLRQAVLGGADARLEYDSLAAMTLNVTQWGYTKVDNIKFQPQ